MTPFTQEMPPVNVRITVQLADGHKTIATYLGNKILQCVDGRQFHNLHIERDFSAEDKKAFAWQLI